MQTAGPSGMIFVKGTTCPGYVAARRFDSQFMNANQWGNKMMKMLLALVFGLTIAGCSNPKKLCEECFAHADCEGALNCRSRPMSDGSVRNVCVDTSEMITCPVPQPEAAK
jgi:hypothetical protein